MTRLHTHYDNLKVSRDAPLEVIRASHKVLVQKYHPDRHGGDAEASRITAAINMMYSELADPRLRKLHDEWITQQEAAQALGTKAESEAPAASSPAAQAAAPARAQPPSAGPVASGGNTEIAESSPAVRHIRNYWYGYCFLAFLIWFANHEIAVSESRQDASAARFERAMFAPNGELWPLKAGYVSGYDRLNRGGSSSVTVDNSQMTTDVMVKLVSLDTSPPTAVRVFFIPAGSRFRVGKITQGSYDIRYRNLDSGALSRSESFTLTEFDDGESTRFTNYTMTLYEVRDGNTRTYKLAEGDF